MSFKNVLCFGSLNPDLVYFIEKLPRPGGDIQSKKYFIRPGGTAINCAENIAMWKINTSAVSYTHLTLPTTPYV